MMHHCFYSILVRLKEKAKTAYSRAREKFLFHTGSIKSRATLHLRVRCARFYSILVRLKAFSVIPDSVRSKSNPSFYSILVRLKGSISSTLYACCVCFYSILVRLKGTEPPAPKQKTRFLFHTGSIKSWVADLVHQAEMDEVSIPYWFD